MTPRGFTRAPVAKQRKHWHQLASNQVDEFTGAATILIDFFEDSDRDPFTVIRMLGEVQVAPDEAGVVAGDACIVTFGIGVVSSDAAAVGSSAMPDPAAEADYPWLWWHSVLLQFPTIGESLAQGVRTVQVESKGMRKLGPGQALALIAQYADLGGFPPVDVLASVRFLVGTS